MSEAVSHKFVVSLEFPAVSYVSGAKIIKSLDLIVFLVEDIERLTDEQREIKKLQKELKESHLDVELLKKAIAFFSRAEK